MGSHVRELARLMTARFLCRAREHREGVISVGPDWIPGPEASEHCEPVVEELAPSTRVELLSETGEFTAAVAAASHAEGEATAAETIERHGLAGQ